MIEGSVPGLINVFNRCRFWNVAIRRRIFVHSRNPDGRRQQWAAACAVIFSLSARSVDTARKRR